MNPDRDINPESRRGIRFAHAAAPLAAVMLLAGCSSAPDWADPTEWFGSESAAESGESAKPAEAKTPGEDKDFPNLASVPERPKAPSEEERKQLADSLAADRENAEYSKDVIRRQSAASVPAPPPPPPSASSVQAQATADAAARANGAAAAAPSTASTGQAGAGQSATGQPAAGQTETGPTAVTPPASTAPVPPVARPAPVTGALTPAPVSRPPQFAPRPPSPVAPAAGANTVPPLAVRPGPNARSVARIGNPSFGAPPADIAAAQDAGNSRQVMPSRFAAPPPVAGTFSNGTAAGGGEPVAMVRFKAGSASLTGNARQQVRRIAGIYKQRGGAIRVEGHASSRTRNMDPVQHHLVNFNVSLNRANAVARELVRQGVPAEAVFVAAMSDSQPLYYEVMPAGDAGNQRVEIHFVN